MIICEVDREYLKPSRFWNKLLLKVNRINFFIYIVIVIVIICTFS